MNETWFKNVLDGLSTHVLIMDGNRNIVCVNDAARALLVARGLAPEEQLGKAIDSFYPDMDSLEKLLEDPDALPYRATFAVENDSWEMQVARISTTSEPSETHFVFSWDVVGKRVELMKTLRSLVEVVAATGMQLEFAAEMVQLGANSTLEVGHGVADSISTLALHTSSVAEAMEEMDVTIADIAQRMAEANRLSGEIHAETGSAQENIGRLAAKTHEISKVARLIDSVADQTSLLALNAAIEAARAGEMGKGFAVVASEVKELSRTTQGATENIATRIGEMQSGVQASVSSVTKVLDLVTLLNDGSSAIAAAVEEQHSTTNETAGAAAQSAQRVQEVNESLQTVIQHAEQTETTAGEIMTAAAGLSMRAAELRKTLDGLLAVR